MKPKVILDPHFRRLNLVFSEEEQERMHSLAEIVWGHDEPMPADELAKHREDAVAIISGSWRHGDVVDFPNLRVIMEIGGTFPSPDSLDYDTCFARGIRVLSCAPAFGPAVAEMGLAMALASARRLVESDRNLRTGDANWSHTEFGDPFLLFDKPVGFIGFGGLARALKPLLAPFRCPIAAYDPWLTDAYLATQGVTPTDVDTLLSTSRVIFALALPTASNRAFLSREKLELIRPDAVFVLLSRAHVVDFDALTDLVLRGRFRAAIDVFPKEPLPSDHPIRQAPLAILSPHRAGGHPEAIFNIGRFVVRDLEAILRGLPPHDMQVAEPEFIRMRG
ncbi:MAG: hydroxyacid dehydrogenase [Armatimonadota bacterium]|nr:MAG: hydroxyacid dehydrogenase [Armatimonadota bacterium]